MYRLKLLILLILLNSNLMSQVRIGWRSIYDTSGRLTRMNYYENGQSLVDSNLFFQYYTDNVIKGIISGDISREEGCRNGSVMLFDETGNMSNYSIKKNGQLIFNMSCEEGEICTPTWVDQFDTQTDCWIADSFSVENSEFILYNNKSVALASYKPPIPIDISGEFALKTDIPKEKNSSKLGLCLGWKNSENFLLFEISYGEYYSVISFEDGVYNQLVEGRKPIDKENDDFNEVKISSNGNNLIFEINQNIEMVIPASKYPVSTIGLMTRSRGAARFSDFLFTYLVPPTDPLFTKPKIGKGTGFFISSTGRILTTYNAIADAKTVFVQGMMNGKVFTLLADVVNVEEEQNIAILQIRDKTFHPFDELPFGYSKRKPVSELNTFSIGFPSATSGIYLKPEIFQGKVLPSGSNSSTGLLVEMSFRYGMIGSPVFDDNANLIGIVSDKGTELKYSEIIDFSKNEHLFLGHMGLTEMERESPFKDKSFEEKFKALSGIVVIVQSSIFNYEKKRGN